MKKTSTLVLTLTLQVIAFSSYAVQSEVSLGKKIKQLEKEFKSNNYENIAKYHGIISLCNSIPDEKSFDGWLVRHSTDEDLNIEHIQQQVDDCKNVTKKGYRTLERLYRKSLKHNVKESKLILASHIPFVSPEKISWLFDSAYWSTESVEMLARISIKHKEELSGVKRLFWLSISQASSFYPEDYQLASIELNSSIDSEKLKAVNELIANWNGASEDGKKEIIIKLELI